MVVCSDANQVIEHLPTTRYRGSKRRFAKMIFEQLKAADPTRIIDPFGGSGSISAVADAMGVNSRYNDRFLWSTRCAKALFAHDYTPAEARQAETIADSCMASAKIGFVSERFEGMYFKPEENLELDGLLNLLDGGSLDEATADLVFYGMSQAALMKMPMSMFHRASLDQKTAQVERKSGNFVTWHKPFRALVPKRIHEAAAFAMRRNADHEVTNVDALKSYRYSRNGDVLFLDPPYVNPRGGPTYDVAYHFIEGFAHGEEVWKNGLNSDVPPIFSKDFASEFETASGWERGLEAIVSRARKHATVGTAREKDDPGAKAMARVLEGIYGNVSESILQSKVIFSKTKNPEKMFTACAV
jgi:adenine-specific DNA-methyltransferase